MMTLDELQALYDRLEAEGPENDEDEEIFADHLNDLYIEISERQAEEQWIHRYD